MSASFKKRLKWYGGIFMLASIVLGVNGFQYNKVRVRYAISQAFVCNQASFYEKQRELNPFAEIKPLEERVKKQANPFGDIAPMGEKNTGLLDGLQTIEQKAKSSMSDNDPRKHLSQSQIKEAEVAYRTCIVNRLDGIQEAKSKKQKANK